MRFLSVSLTLDLGVTEVTGTFLAIDLAVFAFKNLFLILDCDPSSKSTY